MDQIVQFLQGFDIQTILSILVIVWLFTRNIKSELKEIKQELKSIDMRLTRVEIRFDERDRYESKDTGTNGKIKDK